MNANKLHSMRWALLGLAAMVFLSCSAGVQAKNDQIPPAILSISIINVTASGAEVTWVTDEIADSQVEYGTTTSYGSTTQRDHALVLNHSVSLTGLAENTVYHLLIHTRDDANNKTTSSDVVFSTLSSGQQHTIPPIISGISPHNIEATGVHIAWVTDEGADSQIEYGTSTGYGSMTVFDPALNLSHEQLLSNLSPNTLYHFRIYAHDYAGNLSVSQDITFTTLGGIIGGGSGSEAQYRDPFHVEKVEIRSVTTNEAVIAWKTNIPATSVVEYGLTNAYGIGTVKDGNPTRDHVQTIRYLFPNTVYHFQVSSFDAGGHGSYSMDMTFLTDRGVPHRESPQPINDLAIREIKDHAVTLSWTAPKDEVGVTYYDLNYLDEPINENNFYGAAVVHEMVIALDSIDKYGNAHSYEVIGLSPEKTLYFAIKTKDAYGNVSPISNVVSVTPISPGILGDTQPPRKPSEVQAFGLDKMIFLEWENPEDEDFVRVRIVKSAEGYPEDPFAGTVIYDGNSTKISDPGLVNGKTYYYAMFSYDRVPNYSEPVRLSLAPSEEKQHYHMLHLDTEGHVASNTNLEKDLKFGDRGNDVQHLQELLSAYPALYPEGLVTGYFGPLTRSAVERFQKENKLPETGTADEQTRKTLANLPASQLLVEHSREDMFRAFSRSMSYGMEGENVKTLQSYLQTKGFFPKETAANGHFGPVTKKAVIGFQKANGIVPALGYVGPLTRSKILEDLAP